MIDGAQQVTRVILRQVALNTPEPYRNLYMCVCVCVRCCVYCVCPNGTRVRTGIDRSR